MKKLIAIISLVGLLSLPFHLKAQVDPMIGATAEWTVAGTLVGGYAGVKFNDRIGLGALYETRTVEFDSRFNENLSLFGAFINYRLLREGKIDVDIFLRGGYANDRFIIVVPALNFEYFITPRLSAYAMLGVRSEKPAIATGLFYHFRKREIR